MAGDDPLGGGGSGGFSLSGSAFNDIGGAVSDLMSYEGDKYKQQGLQLEEQNYDAAAVLAEQNEQFTKTSTAIKQQQADRELYTSLGRTTAAVAGAGLDLSGSSLDILRQSASEGAATRAVIGQQGLITEAGYQEQAQSYERMKQAAQISENALSTAETGALIGAGLKTAAAVASIAVL